MEADGSRQSNWCVVSTSSYLFKDDYRLFAVANNFGFDGSFAIGVVQNAVDGPQVFGRSRRAVLEQLAVIPELCGTGAVERRGEIMKSRDRES